jgi:hypothetical protein
MTRIPDFDFSQYNPRDDWNFPPQRLVRFAAEAYDLMTTARDAWKSRYTYPDLRFVIWHEMSGHAHAMVVAAMHLRSHGDNIEWWKEQPEFDHAFDKRLIAHNNLLVRQMLQLGFVQNIVRQLDMSLRQIAAGLDKEEEDAKRPLQTVFRSVLKLTDLEHYDRLLPLMLIYRDSLCNHGRFLPVDGQPLTFTYKFKSYHFEANKEIPFQQWAYLDTWDFLLFLLREMKAMLDDIFGAPPVQAMHILRVAYLD